MRSITWIGLFASFLVVDIGAPHRGIAGRELYPAMWNREASP